MTKLKPKATLTVMPKKRWQWCSLIGLGLGVTMLLMTYGKRAPNLIVLTGSTMGTYYQVKYLAQPLLPDAKTIQDDINRRLDRINVLMSTYRADSELSRLNQSRQINQLFPLSPETMTVINEALQLHQLTEGALDITLGPLVNLWGFGPVPAMIERVPSAHDLAKHYAWTGMDKLSVAAGGVIKHIPQLSLDLSSIAKGFAVDQLADYLASVGINHSLVDIGGEIRLKGHNHQRRPWSIAIEIPVDPRQPVQQEHRILVTPGDQALATSGDYRNYFEKAGVRYSHTLDPRSGSPITHRLISVTVLHHSCMRADGLATALNVLGPEKALSIANRLQIPVMLLVNTPTGIAVHHSKAFTAYLNLPKRLS